MILINLGGGVSGGGILDLIIITTDGGLVYDLDENFVLKTEA
jgi:hypothetical protein